MIVVHTWLLGLRIKAQACVPLGMLNPTSPAGITCAFVFLSVVNTGVSKLRGLHPFALIQVELTLVYRRLFSFL
jgi:hypothetical protein